MALITVQRVGEKSKAVNAGVQKNWTADQAKKLFEVPKDSWVTLFMLPHDPDKGCECFHCKADRLHGKWNRPMWAIPFSEFRPKGTCKCPMRPSPKPAHNPGCLPDVYKRPSRWAFRKECFEKNVRFPDLKGGEHFIVYPVTKGV